MKNPRAIAMHVLMQVARRASFPDVLLDTYLKRHPDLDPRDRALATELVYGVLRWQSRLDWIIDQHIRVKTTKTALPVRIVLRLGVYQLLFLERVPPAAAVHEAVELAKSSQPQKIVGFVNGVLRSIAGKRQELKTAIPQDGLLERLAVGYAHPQWMVQGWLQDLGPEETESLCRANNQVAPTTIRVNTLKTSPEILATALLERGLSVVPGSYVPEALRLTGIRMDLSSLPQYAHGDFQVQDEASQLVGHLLGPRPGELILDACAGLGAKSTHLAQFMDNRGKIRAVDREGWKLERLKESARRLQISCLETEEADLLQIEAGRWPERYDRILVDAPCTGLGVLRRNPDIKWRVQPRDVRRLHLLQVGMLGRVAPLLRPGGILVYATCTLTTGENEATVQSFLKGHRDFELENAAGYLPSGCGNMEGRFLRTWPHRHDVDGFFAARLRRTGG